MAEYRDVYYTSTDGLRLYARDYPCRNIGLAEPDTVLCMHGLTRNSADFAGLAGHLSENYRIVSVDNRGRGLSDYDLNIANYTPVTYVQDMFNLLGGLGISRLYNQSEPMLRQLMAEHGTTRARLEAMIDYIESNFAGYEEIDRQLILIAPSAFAEDREQQREIGNSSMASFTRLITAGLELGDVKTDFSPEILASMVVGTLNMLTTCWAMDSNYPIFAKLEEARALFEALICSTTR